MLVDPIGERPIIHDTIVLSFGSLSTNNDGGSLQADLPYNGELQSEKLQNVLNSCVDVETGLEVCLCVCVCTSHVCVCVRCRKGVFVGGGGGEDISL